MLSLALAIPLRGFPPTKVEGTEASSKAAPRLKKQTKNNKGFQQFVILKQTYVFPNMATLQGLE